jgi:hypothetical protein
MRSISRRTFVLGGLATAGLAAGPLRTAYASVPYPFKLGVASGDPPSDGVVLWTRLAPSPLNADGQGGMADADVTVDWQVSTAETFATLVASGSVIARYADAHSAHVLMAEDRPDLMPLRPAGAPNGNSIQLYRRVLGDAGHVPHARHPCHQASSPSTAPSARSPAWCVRDRIRGHSRSSGWSLAAPT